MGKANYFSKQLTLYDQETTDQYVCLDKQSGFSTASAVQYVKELIDVHVFFQPNCPIVIMMTSQLEGENNTH